MKQFDTLAGIIRSVEETRSARSTAKRALESR